MGAVSPLISELPCSPPNPEPSDPLQFPQRGSFPSPARYSPGAGGTYGTVCLAAGLSSPHASPGS